MYMYLLSKNKCLEQRQGYKMQLEGECELQDGKLKNIQGDYFMQKFKKPLFWHGYNWLHR